MTAVLPTLLAVLGLRFASDRLESQFEAHWVTNYQGEVDRLAPCSCALITLLLAVRLTLTDGSSWPFLTLLLIPLAYVLVNRLPRSQFFHAVVRGAACQRALIVGLLRSTVLLLWFSTCSLETPSTTAKISVHWLEIPEVIYFTCDTLLLPTVLLSVAMPMFAKHQLPAAVLTVGLLVFGVQQRTCLSLVADENGSLLVQRFWRWLSIGVRALLNVVYMTNIAETDVPEPFAACSHMMTLFYVMLVGVLPCYGVWTSEYRCRVRFKMERVGQDDNSGDPETGWPDSARWAAAVYLPLLVFFGAILWKGSLSWFAQR